MVAEDEARPVLLIVMGTSGCGKSTFGTMLAQSLYVPFVDGDDLHPISNVEKMSRGEALTDEDRLPWLNKIREKAIQLTHPIHIQKASSRERSSQDQPLPHELDRRQLAEVYETSQQGGHSLDQASFNSDKGGSISQDEQGHTRDKLMTKACVIACSALKRSYRDLLRGKGTDSRLRVIHLYLKIDPEELRRRMHNRKGHFMKESMLQSQLATLEDPTGEDDAIIVLEAAPQEQVKQAREELNKLVQCL